MITCDISLGTVWINAEKIRWKTCDVDGKGTDRHPQYQSRSKSTLAQTPSRVLFIRRTITALSLEKLLEPPDVAIENEERLEISFGESGNGSLMTACNDATHFKADLAQLYKK